MNINNDINFEIINHNKETFKADNYRNWPIVYILKNKKNIYIGETTNFHNRFLQHGKDEEKKMLDDKILICHKKANKSSTYLIESDLINRAFADENEYELLNVKKQTEAIHSSHDFFEKNEFKNELESIWEELRSMGIFNKSYSQIENEELYKYSPWKIFDDRQIEAIEEIKDKINKNENGFVSGSAGTGKTLLIIRIAMEYSFSNDKVIGIYSAKKGNHRTFSRVIKRLGNHYKKKIKVIDDLTPQKLKGIDYILIDEAQRLRRWFRGQGSPWYFREQEENECKDEIKWIEQNNIKYSLFYDLSQSFHKYDMNLEEYIITPSIKLISQYRMKSGDEWIKFVKELLQIEETKNKTYDFGEYEFNIYDSEIELFEKVKYMNESGGDWDNKSRMIASLKFDNKEWKTREAFSNLEKSKNIDYTNIENEFTFGQYQLVWNKEAHYSDWLEKSDVSEVGCIHTVQGRDFKYAGVLFGDDIDFNEGKIIATDEVKNIYYVLLTRGIYGHGIFTRNEKLRKYINDFLDKKKK